MKKMVKTLKKTLSKYNEDLQYLFIVGLPTGLFLILLGNVVKLGEVY
jgi:hypothetical protein